MILTITALVSTALALWYTYWRLKRRRMYELSDKIPSPKAELPLIGVIHKLAFKTHHEIFKTGLSLIEDEKDQEILKLWLGPKLYVFLLNPLDIETLLSSNIHLEKSEEYGVFQPWFGNGLLISSGETWRKHRKLIAPTFHLNVLKRFMTQFNIRGRSVVEKMKKENGKEFDCHEYMSECMVETLVETVMGVRDEFQGKTCSNYAVAVMRMCDIFHSRHTKLWLRPDWIFRMSGLATKQDDLLEKILKFTKRVFNTKKADYDSKKFSSSDQTTEDLKEIAATVDSDDKFSFGQSSLLKDDLDVDEIMGEKKRLPFLESMIETTSMGNGMTNKEIEDQVNTLMFEGHDTTAAGMSFFFCVMADRPDIQEKCHEELDRIFGDSDRDITFQDTVEMKYIERCIMETLRMFPPVPLISRKLGSELKLATNNVILPSGTTVVVGIVRLHRRPEIYKNPDTFDPDNFLPENAVNRHYYSFIPFSAGPRSCVGRKYAMLKLKMIVAHVLRKFRIAGGKPMQDWELQADIIFKRGDGFNIRLEPRTAKVK